mgnify:CR=1 FL=1
MSFTADIYKEILSDVTAETKRTFPFAMRMVKFNNGIMVVFAVNIATRMRSAFLSVASEASKNRFPRWKVSKLIRLLCRPMGLIPPFVVLSQLPNSASDIFEIVVEDLRNQLKAAKIMRNL